MKKKILISIASAIVLLTLIFAGVLFYVSKIITPEQVREIAIDGISKSLPGASPSIGKIDLSLGLSVKLDVDDFSLSLNGKKKGSKLFGVSKANISIPLWAILVGGGTAKVSLSSPSLNYYEYSAKSSNWQLAAKKKKKVRSAKKTKVSSKVSKTKSSSKSGSVALPAFVSRIKADIRLDNLAVSYRLKDGTSGEVLIDRFALKKLNLLSPTAFELKSKMKFVADPKTKKAVSFSTLAIGEFDLSEYIKDNSIKSSLMIKLRDISLGVPEVNIPDVKTNINIEIKKSGVVLGNVKSEFLTRNSVGAKFSVTSKKISVSDIKAGLYVKDLMKIGGHVSPVLNPEKSRVKLNGSIDLVGGKVFPKVDFEVTPTVGINIDSIKARLGAMGSYDGSKLALSSTAELLNGTVTTRVSGKYNINNPPQSIAQFKPFLVVLKATNLQLSEKAIQDIMYSKSTESRPVVESSKSKSSSEEPKKRNSSIKKQRTAIVLPPGQIKIEVAHAKIGKSNFDAKSQITVRPKSIVTKFLDIRFSDGKGKLTHRSNIKQSGVESTFNFSMNSLDLKAVKPFLPPVLNAVSGTFNGKVSGGVNLRNESVSYNILAKVNAKNGELKGLKIGSYLEQVTEIPFLKGKGSKLELKNAGDFETLYLDARLTDKLYSIKKARFVAFKKQFKFNAKGKLYPQPSKKESKLYCSYQDDKYISKTLNKHANTKILPVLLRGKGFDLALDKAYTTKALAKAYGKKNAKKLKKAGKKQLKKIFKKLF